MISDADSAKVAFLPAGGAAFLNRASNSPLHSPARADSPLSHDGEGQAGIQDRMLSIPPSPVVPDRYKSGNSAEVAFLAADASTWLNRQSNQPIPQSGPDSGLAPGAAAAVAAHNSSTRSLLSQTAPPPENGTVAFLPGTASAFLNQNSQSPLGSDGPPTEQGTVPTNDSTRSLPSHVAPAPAGGQVAFLPGDASAFLNRNTNSPLQSVGSTNEQPFPPAAPSSSAPSSIPYSTEAPENGQVTFLPADASGFLNRNSAGPLGILRFPHLRLCRQCIMVELRPPLLGLQCLLLHVLPTETRRKRLPTTSSTTTPNGSAQTTTTAVMCQLLQWPRQLDDRNRLDPCSTSVDRAVARSTTSWQDHPILHRTRMVLCNPRIHSKHLASVVRWRHRLSASQSRMSPSKTSAERTFNPARHARQMYDTPHRPSTYHPARTIRRGSHHSLAKRLLGGQLARTSRGINRARRSWGLVRVAW